MCTYNLINNLKITYRCVYYHTNYEDINLHLFVQNTNINNIVSLFTIN